MPQYVVYRHGWDPTNQDPSRGLPEKMPVARVDAGSPEEACRLAARDVTLVEGQYLSAAPADEVDARVNDLGLKAEAIERMQEG
jgi:hypothetical protein